MLAAPVQLGLRPSHHGLHGHGLAIHVGRSRGSGNAPKLLVLATPCPLGFSPFNLKVPQTHVAVILTAGCCHHITSDSMISAAEILLCLCPSHLPIHKSHGAIIVAWGSLSPTAYASMLATILLLRLPPCGLPIVQPLVAIKVAGGCGCWDGSFCFSKRN